MPTSLDISTPAANSALAIAPAFGWRSATSRGGEAWFKGYMLIGGSLLEGEAAAAYFAALLDRAATPDSLAKELLGVDGQFAAAVSKGGRLLATVDRTRSIPLFYAKSRDGWLIGDLAPALRSRCGLAEADLDAGFEIAMAGYALGRGTLYRGLNQLQAGEMLLIEGRARHSCGVGISTGRGASRKAARGTIGLMGFLARPNGYSKSSWSRWLADR